MVAPLCKCQPPRPSSHRVSQKEGRAYYCCSENACGFFNWEDTIKTTLTLPGPPCKCGLPSILKTSRQPQSLGRTFWSCASTGQKQCRFFAWNEDESLAGHGELVPGSPAVSLPPTPTTGPACSQCHAAVVHRTVGNSNTKGNAGRRYYKCEACSKFEFVSPGPALPPLDDTSTPGSVEHVVDELTRRKLQEVFEVPHGAGLGVGHDVRQMGEGCDHLKVECAWRVTNPQRKARYEAFRQGLLERKGEGAAVTLKESYAAAVDELGEAVNRGANEVLLLHGTRPEVMHGILFEGLDPALARQGLFGAGTYFAEDAAKVDQYVTKDATWKGADTEAPVYKLHRKLYDRGVKHAGDVYYALVCRVALGDPLTTRDGRTACKPESDAGTPLFTDATKSKLQGDKHSLLVETGGLVKRFREFVVFDPAAIDILYLVAFKREKQYCHCGEPVVRRTVTKEGPNHGRPISFCAKPQGNGCGFICMLPLCDCGRAAEVAYKKNGEAYYRCGSTRNWCQWKDWNGPPSARNFGSPSGKRPAGSSFSTPSPAKKGRRFSYHS